MKNLVWWWRNTKWTVDVLKLLSEQSARETFLSDIDIQIPISCQNSMISPWFFINFQILWFFHAWIFFQPFSMFSRACGNHVTIAFWVTFISLVWQYPVTFVLLAFSDVLRNADIIIGAPMNCSHIFCTSQKRKNIELLERLMCCLCVTQRGECLHLNSDPSMSTNHLSVFSANQCTAVILCFTLRLWIQMCNLCCRYNKKYTRWTTVPMFVDEPEFIYGTCNFSPRGLCILN